MIVERQWTPVRQINQLLLELAEDFGPAIPTPARIVTLNRRHGPTSAGRRSDHQGPRHYVWAADLPVASMLEGDRIAWEVSHHLGLQEWTGQGLHTEIRQMNRYQLIWRTDGHWDHVHVGIRGPRALPPVAAAFGGTS
jgi:hypothetical protein